MTNPIFKATVGVFVITFAMLASVVARAEGVPTVSPPPTVVPQEALFEQSQVSCWLGAGVGGHFLRVAGEREAAAEMAGGCDVDIGKAIAIGLGLEARTDFDDWAAGLFARVVVHLNAMTDFYGRVGIEGPEFALDNGKITLGAGLEMDLGHMSGARLYIEADHAVEDLGRSFARDDTRISTGLRFKLGGK